MSTRQFVESQIVRAVISDLLAAPAGFVLSVHSGGDTLDVAPTRDRQTILEALCAVDEAVLFARSPSCWGRVWFVFGNDWDCITNYSASLASYLRRALEMTERYEDQA